MAGDIIQYRICILHKFEQADITRFKIELWNGLCRMHQSSSKNVQTDKTEKKVNKMEIH